jgi:hypothetical protein
VASLELPAPQFGQLSVSACISVYFISLDIDGGLEK